MADTSVDYDSLLDDGDDSLFLFPTDAALAMPSSSARITARSKASLATQTQSMQMGPGPSTILRKPDSLLVKRRVAHGEPERKRFKASARAGVVNQPAAQGQQLTSGKGNAPTTPNDGNTTTSANTNLNNQTNVLNGKQKQWAHPNPFLNPSTVASISSPSIRRGRPKANAGVVDDDEEMPTIQVRGDGGYSVVPQTPPAPPNLDSGPRHGRGPSPNIDLSALQKWGQTTSMPPSYNPSESMIHRAAAGAARSPSKAQPNESRTSPMQTPQTTLSAAELAELAQLRKDKLELQNALRQKQVEIDQAKYAVQSRQGEISVVRARLQRAESAHAAVTAQEKKLRSSMNEKMEAKEKEHRAMIERLRIEHAFSVSLALPPLSRRARNVDDASHQLFHFIQRQEQETSRRMGSSQRPVASQRRGSMPPPPLPFAPSPSLNRTRGGPHAPKPAPTPRKQFGGFHNSFDGSPAPLVPPSTDRSARIGSSRFPMMSSPARARIDKGKNRMLTEDEDDSMVLDREDSRFESRFEDEAEGSESAEPQMEEDPLDANDERDWRSEIISALFNHVTYDHFDQESAIAPPGSTATQRSSASTFSVKGATATSHSSTLRRSTAASIATPDRMVTPISPVPTLHGITNIRFPSTLDPGLSLAYDDRCRELFGLLGRRSDPLVGGSNDAAQLADGIVAVFDGLIDLLDQAGLVGPLINLLSLVGHLVLLFQHFANSYLRETNTPGSRSRHAGEEAASDLLSKVGSLLRRYGRPLPPSRTASDLNPSRSRAKERSKRVRGFAMRANGTSSAMVAVKDDDRVELDPTRRNALLFAISDFVDALAWRASEAGEERFIDLLKSPNAINILLDPHHPPSLLLSTARSIALLACRPSLFRKILDVKFEEATPDSRSSQVPILDRLGALLQLNGTRDPLQPAYKLHMVVLSLLSTLLTRHDDVLVIISTSASLIPELLDKLFKDTRTLWDHDGSDLSDTTRTRLKSLWGPCRIASRLSANVHIFYYLTCALGSTIKIGEWFSESAYSGLHDRFNVAFGTLAFGNLPEWAEATAEGDELIRLSFLAQEIMEDVSPQEADEMELCFAVPGDEAFSAGSGQEELFEYGEEGDEDEEMVIRDLSQQGV
ncbi:BQ2448_7279 [Microbotryum intermedium]|uniref:BQ2448_7279 protein n=1 Tax=Microbotryum intermedium TaxID=269621 RepID=A0A238FMW0_9BASI|nr:BQ2448_7279 [Microbotryum intermedium]